MATISELMEQARAGRECAPAVFHFAEPGLPCAYWTSGEHVVVGGACRCGKRFKLLERV